MWDHQSDNIDRVFHDIVQHHIPNSFIFIVSMLLVWMFAYLIPLTIKVVVRACCGQYASRNSDHASWFTFMKLDSFATLTKAGIWLAGFIISLDLASVNLENLAFITGGVAVGVSIAISPIIQNVASGIILRWVRYVDIGSTLEFRRGGMEIDARIISMGHMYATLEHTSDTVRYAVPYSEFNGIIGYRLVDDQGNVMENRQHPHLPGHAVTWTTVDATQLPKKKRRKRRNSESMYTAGFYSQQDNHLVEL